ncbi:MAG: MBL fold metallo-hydrolase [Lachnospiraceae bacterium]|nr:MBL fold metallo-hydrolase [Lachnospiraceae bacterium]
MKSRFKGIAVIAALTLLCTSVTGCTGIVTAEPGVGTESTEAGGSALDDSIKSATDITAAANQEWYNVLNFSDTSERENAVKGLIDAPESLELIGDDGRVIWSQKAYDFVDDTDKAPDTVNPSLWENVVTNHSYGLFEVTDGIYQVRGYDMANVTFIEGDTGWIIFDTAMGREVAQAAKELVDKNLGEKPIKAVLISHPHVDHFGGVRAFVPEEDEADASLPIEEQIESGKIPIIVPEGFAEHAIAENVYAGTAMSRRANYQYGVMLEKDAQGALSIGIGMGQSRGELTYMMPTWEVTETGQKVTIDGVEIEFQLTPGTEAPAEMNAYFPQKKALWLAENCTGSLHNLYTLRGAEVRDGNAWAEYIMEAVSRYGDRTEVTFQSHNWPHWGKDVVNEYMINTAAVYKYINDETLALLNQGYTSTEITDLLFLPDALAKNWYTRQYYGTVAHDAKAVYQKYMGWYDANPINLNKMSPEESAKKWAEYLDLGGKDAAMQKAREEFDKGEYQWVAEFTNLLVFADPTDQEARYLCADALEQLGYQAESGTWRNCYLSAALELRKGNQTGNLPGNGTFASDLVSNLTPEMTFDYMGILLDRKAVADKSFTIAFNLNDTSETYTVCVRYGALLYTKGTIGDDPDVTVTCPKKALLYLANGQGEEFMKAADIKGDTDAFELLTGALTNIGSGSRGGFNIIEP